MIKQGIDIKKESRKWYKSARFRSNHIADLTSYQNGMLDAINLLSDRQKQDELKNKPTEAAALGIGDVSVSFLYNFVNEFTDTEIPKEAIKETLDKLNEH